MDTATSPLSRTAFAAVVAILMLALVPVALAAKGGNGAKTPTSTSALALEVNGATAAATTATAQPSWGDTVRFLVSDPPADPNVELLCSQNGTVVYSAQTGYYQSTWPYTADMTLRSTAWTGGAAFCTARLFVFSGKTTTTLSTLSFTVGA